jgi:hypothetical protein
MEKRGLLRAKLASTLITSFILLFLGLYYFFAVTLGLWAGRGLIIFGFANFPPLYREYAIYETKTALIAVALLFVGYILAVTTDVNLVRLPRKLFLGIGYLLTILLFWGFISLAIIGISLAVVELFSYGLFTINADLWGVVSYPIFIVAFSTWLPYNLLYLGLDDMHDILYRVLFFIKNDCTDDVDRNVTEVNKLSMHYVHKDSEN